MPQTFSDFFRGLVAQTPTSLPNNWSPDPLADDSLLDPDSPHPARRMFVQTLLHNIQGNILKGHGRDRGALIRFSVDRAGLRSKDFWSEVAREITWGHVQALQAELANATAEKFATFCQQFDLDPATSPDTFALRSFGLTAAGMRAMRVMDNYELNRPIELRDPLTPSANAFNQGMQERFLHIAGASAEFNTWHDHYKDGKRATAGYWFVACTDEKAFDAEVAYIRKWCSDRGLTPFDTELLTTWREKKSPPDTAPRHREPFGFVDGISMPAFFATDKQKGRVGGKWMQMPLKQVLISPEVSRRHAGGSFMVLRNLEQDVAEFRRFEAKLKQELTTAKIQHAEPAALLVGRQRDGKPLVDLQPAPAGSGLHPLNSFDFNGDGDQGPPRCPFHAHIRKVNPRVEGMVVSEARGREIVDAQVVRRGMIMDPEKRLPAAEDKGKPWPTKDDGVGLMFMAFMSDIVGQFEKLHLDWIPSPKFPRQGGPDALLAAQGASLSWNGCPYPAIKDFVIPKGGGYFYAPALPWLLSAKNRARP